MHNILILLQQAQMGDEYDQTISDELTDAIEPAPSDLDVPSTSQGKRE